jgi:altronate hydrolase
VSCHDDPTAFLCHPDVLIIDPDDSVAVALRQLDPSYRIEVPQGSVTLLDTILPGHKFALKDIQEGETVIKYGHSIGIAVKTIQRGELVHTHNLTSNLEDQSYYYHSPRSSHLRSSESQTFQGYRRNNGSVGIRNDIWIIPTVGCIAHVASSLADWGNEMVRDGRFEGIDSCKALSHVHGCSQLGDDHEATVRLLASLASHPNAAGVLVIGLGCENNSLESFVSRIDPSVFDHMKTLNCQSVEDELTEGRILLAQLAAHAQTCERESIDIGQLVVATKCGGSDGFSGITANVLVGLFSDWLVAHGGSAILSEIPEMFGTETILFDRCANVEVYRRLKAVINKQKRHFISHGQPIHENPSPGNKEGGITTLEEKSLGCIRKGGTSTIIDIIDYGKCVTKKGLGILEGPGNDMISITAMAASHAHLVLFTTGRGTPLGTVIPCIKISSNSQLADKKPNWIDFDAGTVLNEGPQPVLQDLIEMIKDVASKRILTNNEHNGFEHIAILKDGVTL